MEPDHRKATKRKANVSGGYLWEYWGKKNGGICGIPQHVFNGPDCRSLNHAAFRLLMNFISQLNGKNNGDLSASSTVMSEYGLTSNDTITRGVKELINKGLIVKTRSGYAGPEGRRLCSLYGVTWLPIDEIDHRVGGEWIPKIRGTRTALRMDFTNHYAGEVKYEAA